MAKKIIIAKIKNQRAVLNHFDKYHQRTILQSASQELLTNVDKAKYVQKFDALLGFEGASANAYFQALRKTDLFSSSFKKREGRGSREN